MLSDEQQLFMVGLQADNASADDRQRLARSAADAIAGGTPGVLLSTCHRVELYGLGVMPSLAPQGRVQTGESAVRQLIRVAAGLESAIVGEDEVLHQVRQALASARSSGTVDSRLTRLFEVATAAGRAVRARRGVASGNLAQRAVAWLQGKASLAGMPVLIVGAGHMGSALAHAAQAAGAEVTIASRTGRRADRLARLYGGRGVDLAGGAEVAFESVAVAVALAGEWRELDSTDQDLPPIADVSAPPAIVAAVRQRLNGGFLSIDDLYIRTDRRPQAFVEMAERVVETKTYEYVSWLNREIGAHA
jgi:glutamyl-tRNA reductase